MRRQMAIFLIITLLISFCVNIALAVFCKQHTSRHSFGQFRFVACKITLNIKAPLKSFLYCSFTTTSSRKQTSVQIINQSLLRSQLIQ